MTATLPPDHDTEAWAALDAIVEDIIERFVEAGRVLTESWSDAFAPLNDYLLDFGRDLSRFSLDERLWLPPQYDYHQSKRGRSPRLDPLIKAREAAIRERVKARQQSTWRWEDHYRPFSEEQP